MGKGTHTRQQRQRQRQSRVWWINTTVHSVCAANVEFAARASQRHRRRTGHGTRAYMHHNVRMNAHFAARGEPRLLSEYDLSGGKRRWMGEKRRARGGSAHEISTKLRQLRLVPSSESRKSMKFVRGERRLSSVPRRLRVFLELGVEDSRLRDGAGDGTTTSSSS